MRQDQSRSQYPHPSASSFGPLVSLAVASLRALALPPSAAKGYSVGVPVSVRKLGQAHLILVRPLYTVSRHVFPFAISTDPKLRMYLVFRYHLALQQMAHQEIVVHSLCNDLGYGLGIEFKEAIMLGSTRLRLGA